MYPVKFLVMNLDQLIHILEYFFKPNEFSLLSYQNKIIWPVKQGGLVGRTERTKREAACPFSVHFWGSVFFGILGPLGSGHRCIFTYQIFFFWETTTFNKPGNFGIKGLVVKIQQWKTQQWPRDQKRSVFIPIPKKGNAKECSN